MEDLRLLSGERQNAYERAELRTFVDNKNN